MTPEQRKIEKLEDQVEKLKALVEDQDEFLKQVTESPKVYATVIALQEAGLTDPTGFAIVSMDGKLHEVNYPKHTQVRPGDTVAIVPLSGQIFAVGKVRDHGEVSFIRKVLPDGLVEIEHQGGSRFVRPGMVTDLDEGCRVLLDRSGQIVIESLGKPGDEFKRGDTGVTWDDIGGLEDAKRQLIETVELPHTHPGVFEHFGNKPPSGILLLGPPGCGKTMLGKATATSLSKTHGGKSDPFIYVKGPEILNKYVGESEATIRHIFARAKDHKRKTGCPAVVFIDEAESVLSRRGTGVSSDIDKTIVPAFLAEMDGIDEKSAVVILATNRADRLDPAVVRDGRIDRKVTVSRPGPNEVCQIVHLHLRGKPVETPAPEISAIAAEEIASPRRRLYEVGFKGGQRETLTLQDVVSGAMAANIVNRATSFALNRALETRKNGGVRVDDVVRAIDMVEEESRRVNHDDEVKEFAERRGLGEVKGVSVLERMAAE